MTDVYFKSRFPCWMYQLFSTSLTSPDEFLSTFGITLSGPFVVDLKFPSVVHTFKHHTTAIDISDDSEMMVCNDGESLQVYEVSNKTVTHMLGI